MTIQLAQLIALVKLFPKLGMFQFVIDCDGKSLKWHFTRGGPVKNITSEDIGAIETIRNVRVWKPTTKDIIRREKLEVTDKSMDVE